MAQVLPIFLAVAGAFAGTGYAVSACMREWFHGQALLLRAKRGDPDPPTIIQITDRTMGQR